MNDKELVRFNKNVTLGDSGCLVWNGTIDNGYGRFYSHGYSPAHRVSYEHYIGAIPAGLQLDHLCHNRACVNPCHLEPVTQRENILRGEGLCSINAKKTHCKKNHELSESNVRVRKGMRRCLICERQGQRDRDARLKREGHPRWAKVAPRKRK